MIRKKNESAVSEVISVVLVVALTVILAAIVAAYMFGMIPNMPTSQTIAITATQVDKDQIKVVYHGGPDQANLVSLNITWPSGSRQLIPQPKIGDVYTAINPTGGIANVTAGKDHVVVAAHYVNSKDQVVLDTLV